MTDSISEVVLKRTRLSCMVVFNPAVLEQMECAIRDIGGDFNQAILSLPLWQEPLGGHSGEAYCDEPATWWDLFKTEKFPAWALKRWPPKTKRVARTMAFQAWAVYPQFALLHPEQECRIKYELLAEHSPPMRRYVDERKGWVSDG